MSKIKLKVTLYYYYYYYFAFQTSHARQTLYIRLAEQR